MKRASLGWISISGYGNKEFDVWLPEGVRVFRRPALMPYELKTHGAKNYHYRNRARGSTIDRKKKIEAARCREDKERRTQLREDYIASESVSTDPVTKLVEEGAGNVKEAPLVDEETAKLFSE